MARMPRGPLALGLATLVVSLPVRAAAQEAEEERDPAEVAVGERLFLEPRFSQYFFARSGGDPNAVLPEGDPTVATLSTPAGPIPSPFAGQAISCRTCHLVDDAKPIPGGGSRAYADFAVASPVPPRADGLVATPRNSPTLVGAMLPRERRPLVLHFDGEFASAPELVRGTMTGRNYGWLPEEREAAVAHVARVVRGDDGRGALARDFGGSYARVLAGTDRTIPPALRLPQRFRIDVARATDAEILDAVARLVGAYLASLEFEATSPYDRFLAKNHLPDAPHDGEPVAVYLQRLRLLLREVEEPAWVDDADGPFALHDQPFAFGPLELEGLRVFLDRTRGNCVACHPPPAFTDFGLHDTGIAQVDYDRVHGRGAFVALHIPGAAERSADPAAWLPASAAHPRAREPFRAVVDAAQPGRTDLGAWNLVANPDLADRRLQRRLARLVCGAHGVRGACRRLARDPEALLAASVALFKTPGLRDLAHTGPYFHTGSAARVEDAVEHYVEASRLARAGLLRTGDPELARIALAPSDVTALAAFLRSLNEDYE